MSTQHYDETLGSKPPQNYERFFVPTIGEPVAKVLIRKAALQPDERVLDVACGTGIIARLALQKVGNNGTVTGLDINPGMLAVARSIVPDAITWHEAGAEDMPFSDESFDVVICQMGLQFMEDKPAALKEMYRVLLPGGRLILNVPGPAGNVFEILAEAMGQNINPEAEEFVKHVFSLNDTGEIRQLINDAGFRNPEIKSKNKMLSLPTPKEFFHQYIQSTPLSNIWANADESTRSTLEEEVVEQWQELINGDAFMYKQRVITASARK